MKKLSRDAQLGLGLLVLLVIVTAVLATRRQTGQRLPALSSQSAAPDGALALKLWVQALKYPVNEQVLAEFVPPPEASILFSLEPVFPTEAELDALDAWVERGGTLIAIGEAYGMYSLVDHYGFSFEYLSPEAQQAPGPSAPLLLSPAAFELSQAGLRRALATRTRDDFVTLVSAQGQPALVAFEQGQGRVILGTLAAAFTNAGLKESGNPEIVLNILALAGQRGTIWFDEWHHGVRATSKEVIGPADFLRSTPVGRALLFLTLAVFLALILQGRGFGRPVPPPQELRRRSALEHVTGVANLSRRAGHRAAVLQYYHDQLKRKLGQRYRLDPGLDDELYVNTLAGYNPAIDRAGLLSLLKRLKRRDVSETELVHLAREAAHWTDD